MAMTFRMLMMVFIMGVTLTACQSLPPTAHLPDSIQLTERVHLAHEALLAKRMNNQSDHSQAYLNQRDDDRATGFLGKEINRAADIPATQGEPSLSTIIDEQTEYHPTLSGYYPIATGANAFASRSILSDMATHTIDVQYYIWHDDEAGFLMLKDLWQAAERGVLVRLLLDDFNGNPRLDEQLALFAKHPNIAVRVVNPFTYRRYKFMNYLTSPVRINVRMHNKSMTFDNHISIIGGRNIGNEYLNNHQNNHFADLDVLLIGEVVGDITKSFDEYWQSPTAYDIETLVSTDKERPHQSAMAVFSKDNDDGLNATKNERALRTYRSAVASSTIGEDLLSKNVPFRWVNMKFLADDVAKLNTKAKNQNPKDGHLVSKLRHELGRPKERLSIISSYFVPTKDGVHTLTTLAKDGVDVSILTNSFDATDVGAVHAGYGHWRRELLSAGVKIYELKSTAKSTSEDENKLWRTKRMTTTSLHAKAFAVDDHKVFIGSYNIDPRSANINTELGVMIYDEELAYQLHNALNNAGDQENLTILNQVYEVRLVDGRLQWRTLERGQEVIFDKEPHMNTPESIGVSFMSWLPIDWLL
ncbi:phospholipase D family protein [Moraxella sp. K127]|nr:phospholipase D family protein [Moraxella sp. K127]